MPVPASSRALGAGFIRIGALSARLFAPFHGGDMKD
jgi:hypothetical protein